MLDKIKLFYANNKTVVLIVAGLVAVIVLYKKFKR